MSEKKNLDKDILVIPVEKISHIGLGFNKIIKEDILKLAEQGEYKKRFLMEEDKRFKQFIPYIAIKQGNKIFTYQRSKSGGENRLYNKWTLGVGGHVDYPDNLIMATLREVEEELNLKITEDDLNFVGLINADATDVDLVHLGVAIIVEVKKDFNYQNGELDKLINRVFYNKEDLEKKKNNFEYWSKIFYEEYIKKVL